MGYYASSRESDFFISHDRKAEALEAVKKALPECVDTESMNCLEDVIGRFDYSCDTDNDGNIVDIWYEFSKLLVEDTLWNALAPFIKHGSYIEMQGEDGALWRYVFKDGQMKEINAKIVWEE